MITYAHEGMSEESRHLSDLAASYLDRDSGRGGYRAGTELGWAGIGLPEELGGSGGSARELAVLVEAIGYRLAASSIPWTTGVVGRLAASGPRPIADLVASISSGKLTVAIPVRPPARLASGLADEIRNRRVISAEFEALGPPDAELLAVPAVLAETEGIYLVAADNPAVSLTEQSAADFTRPYLKATITDLPLADAPFVIESALLFERWQALLAVMLGFDAIGSARRAFERTIEYARIREQFGRPIGSFQAYKHRCATAFIELKLAQSHSFRAAGADPALPGAMFAAASVSASSASFICGEAVQLHGGIGFTWEAGLHSHLRRARADELLIEDACQASKGLLLTRNRLRAARE